MDTIEKRVRDRAYYLWLEEGRPHGRDQEHWQRAHALLGLAKGDDAQQLPPSMPEAHDEERALAAAAPVPAKPEHTHSATPKTAKEPAAKPAGKSGAAKKASASKQKDKGKAAKP